ncbi:MAG: glycosyltransferase family 2 protein [Acidobacteriota bacterium]
MIYLFYTLAALVVIQGIFSLIEGSSFRSFVRRSLNQDIEPFTPKASVIAPCKGIDRDMEENLSALFDQNYADYEIIFVIASPDDGARTLIERIINENPDQKSKLVIAPPNDNRGEKVNNLLAAIEHASRDTEAFVFVDSDARVHPEWLGALVAPLASDRTGAATGYRWYLPAKGGFWSALLSAWNGSVTTMLGDHSHNFAWGGSTAVQRETFERAGVRESWQKALSDDYALTRAVQRAGLKIVFVPRCLLPSREDASFSSLMEFTTRQVTITRVYRPRAWWTGIISHALFVSTFFGGIAWMLIGGINRVLPLAMLALIYLLGSLKGALRMFAAREAISEARDEITRLWWMYCLLWPMVSLVFLYNFIRSSLTVRVKWRGIIYEMRSAEETIIVAEEPFG